MLLDDVLDTLVSKVKQYRHLREYSPDKEEQRKWQNYEDGYINAVTDIYGLGAALAIERVIAGRDPHARGETL